MSEPPVRALEPADRPAVAALVARVENFSPEEMETALELIDEWLDEGEASEYLCYVVEDAGTIRGFICFGPAPLTDGAYDVYWIAVDPGSQGRGFGQVLLRFAESDIARRQGRLILIETASQATYAATVRFYERAGYQLVSRIRNYYKAGDDKLTFAKELGPA
jgi:ribosomal protein S18 acetylase RimI-like enzyme